MGTHRFGGPVRPSIVARAVAVAVWSLGVATGTALAHGGHAADGHGGPPSLALSLAVLVGGGAVLGTGVYLEHTETLEGKLVRAATLLGVCGVVAGVGLLWAGL